VDASVTLEEEDPDLVERIVNYFYTLQYPTPGTTEHSNMVDEGNSIMHARMYAIADKYDIPGLRDAAENALESLLEHIAAINSPMSFITELLQVVYEMTPTHDRTLRDIVYDFIKNDQHKLLGRKSVQDYALTNHDFGTDVLKIQLDIWKRTNLLWCVKCRSYKRPTEHRDKAGHGFLDGF
jgi:hypothetical protein